jgi:hypothetical protein
MGSFALASVEIGIRSIIFAIPVAFVAQWCGVPPSWKSFAFVMFCCFWNDCVFGGKGIRPARAIHPQPEIARQRRLR